MESGYIEELIEDEPLSLFPNIGNTETADKFPGKILEGRIGILIDGTPLALAVPFLFIESIQRAEDYYTSLFLSILYRALKIATFHFTLFLTAIYIALQDFHPDIFPQTFLQTLQASKIDVPVPPSIEAISWYFQLAQYFYLYSHKSISKTYPLYWKMALFKFKSHSPYNCLMPVKPFFSCLYGSLV